MRSYTVKNEHNTFMYLHQQQILSNKYCNTFNALKCQRMCAGATV